MLPYGETINSVVAHYFSSITHLLLLRATRYVKVEVYRIEGGCSIFLDYALWGSFSFQLNYGGGGSMSLRLLLALQMLKYDVVWSIWSSNLMEHAHRARLLLAYDK